MSDRADYQTDVISDAFEFLRYNGRDIKEAIEEETDGLNAVLNGGIYDLFCQDLHSRTYSWMEAATIIENCKNEEEDASLWFGRKMEGMVQVCAVYSYANDVWAMAVKLYSDLLDEYEPSFKVVTPEGKTIESFEDELDAEDFIDKQAVVIGTETIAAGLQIEEDSNLNAIWDKFVKEHSDGSDDL